MKKADILTGLILLATAIYITVVSYGMTLWTTGRDSAPGPGFVPFIAGIALIVLSVTLILRALLTAQTAGVKIFTWEKIKPLLIIGGSGLIASMLTSTLGFIISMGLMGGFLTLAFSEKRNWFLILGVTIAIPVAFHLIFSVGLSARLPVGIFGI